MHRKPLLTLIENEAVAVTLPEWAGGGVAEIDSSGLLFVAGGAFEGLYDAVYDRVTVGTDRGALQPVTVVEGGKVRQETPFVLRDWLRAEDLFDYGMSPQFLSRFDAVVLLRDLGPDELVRIFLENRDSGYRQARDYFASQGIELAMSPAAVRRVAEEAARQPRLGARALKEVFRRVIRDYEFDPPPGAIGARQDPAHRSAGGGAGPDPVLCARLRRQAMIRGGRNDSASTANVANSRLRRTPARSAPARRRSGDEAK